MSLSADLLIVGGGIAGLSTALAAADQGLGVALLDVARPGAASRAAAGMLAPSVEGLPAEVKAVAIEARDFYPGFLDRLRARADLDVALDRNGILQLAASGEHLARLASTAGANAQVLDAAALLRLEPAYEGHAGAVLHPGDGSVDNVALMRALDVAVEREPRIRRIAETAASVTFGNGRVALVTSVQTRLEAAAMLFAPGAWTGSVSGLPRALPVSPVRGQLLRLSRQPIGHVTYGAGGYLVPRGESLLIGATSEETGFTNHTTTEGRSSLLDIASRAIPGLSSATVVEHWAGLRPVTPDALPILGRDPDVPELLYAGGFSRNGILLAPWAAAQLAALLAAVLAGENGADSLAVFSVARFDKRSLTN
ncbi:MAG: FAD-dependent oxidoreductase [bacterium]